jgi:hypothetical protein
MKKAKLILAGIACMAVVGGAFAFKASRTPRVLYYPTDVSKKLCTNSTITFLTLTPVGISTTYYTTTPTTTGCPTFTTISQ